MAGLGNGWTRTGKPASVEDLDRAADAARSLQDAFDDLNADDREWVEQLLAKTQYKYWIPALPRAVQGLAGLFSIAVGRAPPQGSSAPNKRGRRRGDVKDLVFREFVRYLLVVTEEWCSGDLTFDRVYEEGTLLDTIKILRRYLPKGSVPTPLPLMTIQRIRDKSTRYTGLPI